MRVAKQKKSETLAGRVESKIVRASEIESNVRMLIFGRSGVGKTRLGATAPDVLLIDINEKGTMSTRRDLDPHVFPVDNWLEIPELYWYLHSGDHDFKSYCIDGATAMQNLCMKFVMGEEASRDSSKQPDMPTRQAWGIMSELMKTTITNFRNLPMNGIFTALPRTRSVGEDEDEMEMIISPNVSPSVAGHLEAAVDVIGYLQVREVKVRKKGTDRVRTKKRSRLQVGPSERYVTKDRTGVFPPYIDDPDLSAMMALIFEEEEAQSG